MLAEVRSWSAFRGQWRERIREIINADKRPSGKACILAYLKIFVGRDVRTTELMVVSGIAEYARRVRELRVQEGYKIVSGTTSPESGVAHGCYRLFSAEPDEQEGAAWKSASRIRRRKGSHESRILALLQANVGVPLTHDMLKYVGKGKDTRERLRDLRLEKGWRIATHRTGRPDLRNDQYVLTNGTPLPAHDRDIPVETYEHVLERDHRRCRKCNWNPEDGRGGKRHSLEVHHVLPFARGGSHDDANLVTLCNMDHDIAHRDKIESAPAMRSWLRKRPKYFVAGRSR